LLAAPSRERAETQSAEPQSAASKRSAFRLGGEGGCVADWAKLERDVVLRIRALAAFDSLPDNDTKRKLWNDVVLPNVRLLGEFCCNVQVEETGAPGVRDPEFTCEYFEPGDSTAAEVLAACGAEMKDRDGR